MKKAIAGLLFLVPLAANAVEIQIDDATDSFAPFGDFAEISGFDDASSPGQVLEVLGGPGQGTAADFAAGNTVTFGEIWDTLNTGGVTNASILGFGFGINETGPVGSNSVLVDQITFDFEGIGIFDLDAGDDVSVFNYNQGQNTAEAIFFIDLGLDFMTTYNSGSTEALFLSAILDGTDDGFEILFLGSAFSSTDPCVIDPSAPGCPNPMPEPGILLLLGTGLVGLAITRRRLRA